MKFITAVFAITLSACLAIPNEFNPRIIGGSDAAQGQFKYQVSLQLLGFHNCGGSILSTTKILTAAHCLRDPTPYTVVAGILRIGDHGGQKVQEAHRVIHPDYRGDSLDNDVGIIHLRIPLEFNKNVQPIALRQSRPRPGENLILSGWGYIAYGENIPPTEATTLQWLRMAVLDIPTCKAWLSNFHISNQQVCTIMPAGKGVCQGDSGSPLVDANGQQVGIVSWGVPCAQGFPDVFSSVPYYYSWISKQ